MTKVAMCGDGIWLCLDRMSKDVEVGTIEYQSAVRADIVTAEWEQLLHQKMVELTFYQEK